jgi:hypothetical protein
MCRKAWQDLLPDGIIHVIFPTLARLTGYFYAVAKVYALAKTITLFADLCTGRNLGEHHV